MLFAISAAIFLATASLVAVSGYWLIVRRQPVAAARDSPALSAAGQSPQGWEAAFAGLGERRPLGQPAQSEAKRRLAAAGYRAPWALNVFSGLRIASAVAAAAISLAVIAAASGNWAGALAGAILGAALGLRLPLRWLGRAARKRQERIRRALPDFLDLLVIAIESGLALDQALSEAARDLRRAHPDLSGELALFSREVLTGTSRAAALRNLGERCGEPEMRRLASLLIQTDRFGSSVSKVLRTQARLMRVKRRQQAEERAHKLGVKLIFPIFFLIMPTVFLIAAGPAVLMLFQSFSKMSNKF